MSIKRKRSFLIIVLVFLSIQASADLPVFDARATCGAKGDGVADDTLAIQSCIDQMARLPAQPSKFRAKLYFPPGRYYFTRQAQLWDDTLDTKGTGNCPTDDEKVHWYALRLRAGIVVEGAGADKTTLTIVRRLPHLPGKPAEKVYLFHFGHWNVDPLPKILKATEAACLKRGIPAPKHAYDYHPSWGGNSSHLKIRNLRMLGTTEPENAAISVQHGYNVLIENVTTRNWYRSLKISRSVHVTVKNSRIENTRYIGIAIYASHAHGRVGFQPTRRNTIEGNTIVNETAFIRQELTREAREKASGQRASHYKGFGLYVSGWRVDLLHNRLLHSGITLEDIGHSLTKGNRVDSYSVGIRVGYLERGIYKDVQVTENRIQRTVAGIVVNDHLRDDDVVRIENNHLSDFLRWGERPDIESLFIGHGRVPAGINVEDSQKVSISGNRIEGLSANTQLAGIRVANSILNTSSNDCVSRKSLEEITAESRAAQRPLVIRPLQKIDLNRNVISFRDDQDAAHGLGYYVENATEIRFSENVFRAASPGRSIASTVLGVGTGAGTCQGPSLGCPRRVFWTHPLHRNSITRRSCPTPSLNAPREDW